VNLIDRESAYEIQKKISRVEDKIEQEQTGKASKAEDSKVQC
jgi:hypothetical protein